MRRVYKISSMLVNEKKITTLVIDSHVDKHADHINDRIIVKAVAKLDRGLYVPVSQKDSFEYFATEVFLEGCWYRLVWLIEEECFYIGVITLYRDRRIK